MKREIRRFQTEIRASKDGRTLGGHAVVWNAVADLGWVKERFIRGAFTRFLSEGGDARALVNHDDAKIIARQSAGTLAVSEDDIGLAFSIDVAQTSYGDDVLESVRRGDITGMSFGFSVRAERLLEKENMREVTDAFLWEVSPVTFPAYDATSVAIRSAADVDPDLAKRFADLRKPQAPVDDLALYFRKMKLEILERGFRN